MKTRNRFEGLRCLVTGATSGLGRAIALELAGRGARLFVTGRSKERLELALEAIARVQSQRVGSCRADLTDARALTGLVAEVSAYYDGELDLVVHSAGLGAYGRFVSHDASILPRLLAINCVAVTELSRGVYPMLLRGRSPALVVIGSVVARRGLPGRSEYSASKFAIAGFVEALRAEWSSVGIGVLLVNPGFTRTDFEKNAIVDTAYLKAEQRRLMSAEEVARRTLRALERGKHEVTFTAQGRALLLANRLSPRLVDWGLARWTRKLYERFGVDDRR